MFETGLSQPALGELAALIHGQLHRRLVVSECAVLPAQMGDRFAVLVELFENGHYVDLSWSVTCK